MTHDSIEKNSFQISYKQPTKIELFENVVNTISIICKLDGNFKSNPAKVNFKEYCFVEIEMKTNKPFDEFRVVAYYLSIFFSMLCNEKLNIFKCIAYLDDKDSNQHVEIVQHHFEENETKNYLLPLISFQELSEQQAIFEKLILHQKDLLTILNIIYQTQNEKKYFDAYSFLAYTQCFEGFFQRFLETEYRIKFPIKEKKDIKLRQIIKKILDDFPAKIKKEMIQDETTFISQVVESRNFYTHLKVQKKENVLEGRQLFKLSEQLRFIITYTILIFLGLDNNKLEDSLFKHKSSKFYQAFRN